MQTYIYLCWAESRDDAWKPNRLVGPEYDADEHRIFCGMSAWFVTGLRASLFGIGPIKPSAVLQSAFGTSAETENNDLRTLMLESAAFDTKHLWRYSVLSLPDRAELYQQAQYSPMADTAAYKKLVPVKTVVTTFLGNVGNGLMSIGNRPVARIALGVSVRWTVSDQKQSILKLVEKVPGLPLADTDEDIVFRRNQPINVDVAGNQIRFNKIATWKTAQMMSMVLSANAPATSSQERTYAIQLETDVNTHQGRSDPFPAHLVRPIIDALARETLQLIPEEKP